METNKHDEMVKNRAKETYKKIKSNVEEDVIVKNKFYDEEEHAYEPTIKKREKEYYIEDLPTHIHYEKWLEINIQPLIESKNYDDKLKLGSMIQDMIIMADLCLLPPETFKKYHTCDYDEKRKELFNVFD